nr:4400_t:CDS:2 [Entrophospora candida]
MSKIFQFLKCCEFFFNNDNDKERLLEQITNLKDEVDIKNEDIKQLKYKLITEMEINESLSEENEQLKKNEEKNRGENTLNVKFAWTISKFLTTSAIVLSSVIESIEDKDDDEEGEEAFEIHGIEYAVK